MLGFALFSVLIGCIVVPIIYIITKCISFFGDYWGSVEKRQDETQGELDQDALLKIHGYEIGDKIGQGTYADVKKAFCINNQKDVAVKIVNKIEVIITAV